MTRIGAPLEKAARAPKVPAEIPISAPPRDHSLLGLAGALGIEKLESETMLLKDASILTKLGD